MQTPKLFATLCAFIAFFLAFTLSPVRGEDSGQNEPSKKCTCKDCPKCAVCGGCLCKNCECEGCPKCTCENGIKTCSKCGECACEKCRCQECGKCRCEKCNCKKTTQTTRKSSCTRGACTR